MNTNVPNFLKACINGFYILKTTKCSQVVLTLIMIFQIEFLTHFECKVIRVRDNNLSMCSSIKLSFFYVLEVHICINSYLDK